MKKALLDYPGSAHTCFGYSQENPEDQSSPAVRLNPPFSYKMMEPNEDLRKVNVFIEERKAGNIKENELILGSSLIALGDYQQSDIDS
tara:strand:- start:554 stop:817 length:264 start_codon:yes stop_codon:yes gene_type:complete